MTDPSFLNGTVELMLLAVVAEGPSYGYEITQSVLSRSGGRFDVKEGSLYPALHRLERQQALAIALDGTRRPPPQVLPAHAGRPQGARVPPQRMAVVLRGTPRSAGAGDECG